MKLARHVILLLVLACQSCATTGEGPAPKPTPISHGKVGALPYSFTETMSLGTSGTSANQNVAAEDQLGFSVRTTGTASGTWAVQYSNDGVNWDTYTLSTTPPAATGSPQTFGITLDFYEFGWIRIQFTNTSGTGTATIQTQMKAI